MKVNQRTKTKGTYVGTVVDDSYPKEIDSKVSKRDYDIKKRMVSEFDKMIRRTHGA